MHRHLLLGILVLRCIIFHVYNRIVYACVRDFAYFWWPFYLRVHYRYSPSEAKSYASVINAARDQHQVVTELFQKMPSRSLAWASHGEGLVWNCRGLGMKIHMLICYSTFRILSVTERGMFFCFWLSGRWLFFLMAMVIRYHVDFYIRGRMERASLVKNNTKFGLGWILMLKNDTSTGLRQHILTPDVDVGVSDAERKLTTYL